MTEYKLFYYLVNKRFLFGMLYFGDHSICIRYSAAIIIYRFYCICCDRLQKYVFRFSGFFLYMCYTTISLSTKTCFHVQKTPILKSVPECLQQTRWRNGDCLSAMWWTVKVSLTWTRTKPTNVNRNIWLTQPNFSMLNLKRDIKRSFKGHTGTWTWED